MMRRGFVPAQTLIKANDQPRACRGRLPRNPLSLSPATVRLLVVRPVKLRLCPFLLLAFLLEDGDVDATAVAIAAAAACRRWYASAFPHDFSTGWAGMGYFFRVVRSSKFASAKREDAESESSAFFLCRRFKNPMLFPWKTPAWGKKIICDR